MHWPGLWRRAAIFLLYAGLEGPRWSSCDSAGGFAYAAGWSIRRKLDAREKTRDLWNHGFNHYMTFAFPFDELRPLSCTGRGPDWDDPHNFGNNDVAGNFSLTLIDVLDTFVVLNDRPGFETAVRNVIDRVSFDVNTKPQVFETTIRVLGGLLSAHLFASDASHPFGLPWYRGELLNLAHDLGKRLLPAFSTPTGLPFARLNLRHGVMSGESFETCTAGAGSLMLEFATLSRLTGDERFEKAAFKAFFALWNRKSDIGLVGNTINTWTGKWLSPEVTGIGAGIDSFYEYALKWYILSGDVEFLDVWHEAYAAIMRYARGSDGFWFRSVNIHTGDIAYSVTDSLSAFWPGLQVLAGDVENAIKSHLIFWNLWKRNAGLPEVWDINFMQATSHQYPLRPEFIESTYYLYRATKDTFYLDVGERILYDLILRAKVDCGLSGILDLRTNKRDDRMESFVLSETLKYLFLLFDEANPLHKDDSNFVFTTEGHILKLGREHLKPLSSVRRRQRRVENLQCPAYEPPLQGIYNSDSDKGLLGGVRMRKDIDYVRTLVGAAVTKGEENWWSPSGRCQLPTVELYSYDFVLSASGKAVSEDPTPSPRKLLEVRDGWIMQNVTGIRTHIVSRLDGKGYDIVKLGPHKVLSGQTVYVNDTDLGGTYADVSTVVDDFFATGLRPKDLPLRFFISSNDPSFEVPPDVQETVAEITAMSYPALFGANPVVLSKDGQPPRFGHGKGVRVMRVAANTHGCDTYDHNSFLEDSVVLMHRGQCTFLLKLLNAAAAGAAGVVVINYDDFPINPSAEESEILAAGKFLDEVVAVVLSNSSGEEITDMMDSVEANGFSELMMSVEPEGQSGVPESREIFDRLSNERKRTREKAKVLYLNGHPLLNTRLLI
ncbi:alpha-mannosidase [Rickenella mellea]|uniref:alpha-1,2-Mannosidase n=1 Tax=Rickenella mellea TaxID=50990 RepID=A0A4R5XGN4_9AGAM|nr:alpha-mannosidase [Rickenella mellea]